MSTKALTEEEIKQREERFRYTDRNHPLIEVLFNLQLPENKPVEPEQ
jgi:hypothetical protein